MTLARRNPSQPLAIVSPSRFNSYKDVDWFKEALARPDAFLSKPFFGDISKRPLANLVMPIKNAQGDALRLEQALINLCGNAVKFTAQGEVALVVEALHTQPDHRTLLRFSVRGTGLGLAITKQLVELMGGSIGVHSTPERGSEFFFTLALAAGRVDAVEPRVPLRSAQPSGTAPGGSRWALNGVPSALIGARILLAEDNELNLIVATDRWTATRPPDRSARCQRCKACRSSP